MKWWRTTELELLSVEPNFTLLSIPKLEAELGEDPIYIRKKDTFHMQLGGIKINH